MTPFQAWRRQPLPADTVRALVLLRRNPEWRHPFRVYLGALARAGWPMDVLAAALGLSYERVRQLVINEPYVEQSLAEYRLILGLALDVPAHAPRPPAGQKIRHPGRPKKARKPLPPDYSGRGRPRQSRCKRGHPLSGENLYVHRRARFCRECARLRRAGKI